LRRGGREAGSDCGDAETGQQTDHRLSDKNRSVAWSEESVNCGQKRRIARGAHVGGRQLAVDEEAVDAVVKPVLCEGVVEFGVARGKWKANDEKEAQREPSQEGGGEVYPRNRQAKYAEGETLWDYSALVSIGEDAARETIAFYRARHVTSKV
jgi:hypothetical protein